MTVRKAVILAAGHGTRFLPATKVVPKEMLPLVDAPVIQYIVEEAIAAGIQQIVMVTAEPKRAIEDHFDHAVDLEQALAEAGKDKPLQEVRRLADIDLVFVRQKERRGNGHAVLMARSIIGDDPFALYFPDDVIVSQVPAIKQLMDVYDRLGHSVVAVQEVPTEQVTMYGVIEPEPVEDRVYRVKRIIEKPSLEEAPSNLATVGRFVLGPAALPVLEATPPGRAGEIWLMDALHQLAQQEPVYALQFEGQRFDTGQPLGLLEASIALGLQREDIGPELKRYLKSLSLD